MRRELIPLLGLFLLACGSSSGGPAYESTTQINPNLPSEEVTAYPTPDVSPPAVVPPLDAGTAGDASGRE